METIKRLEIKRDPVLYAFYAVVVGALTYLLTQHVVTWREVEIFVTGLLLPSVVGLGKPKAGEIKNDTSDVVPVTDAVTDAETKPEDKPSDLNN